MVRFTTAESVLHFHQQLAGLVSAFVAIGKNEGIAGYWRGLSAFLPRVCIYSGAHFPSAAP